MEPQQKLFTSLLVNLKQQYGVIYEFLPPLENTNYPMIILGETQLNDLANKTAVFGSVSQRIHIYSTIKERGTLSEMLLGIKTLCRNLRETKNFNWNVTNIDQRILTDKSTNTPLYHGVLDVDFIFS